MKISDIMDFFCNIFLIFRMIEALHKEAKYIMKELADEKHNLPIKTALHKYRPTYSVMRVGIDTFGDPIFQKSLQN